MPSNLTIFANFLIDDEERYLRLKDSLQSLKNIQTDRFVVNVRGSFSKQAIDYIKSHVSPLYIFSIESPTGWFYDTSRIAHLIKTKYVLIWLEDHICMAPNLVNAVVDDMEKTSSDILTYSFWHGGNFLKRYSHVTQYDQGSLMWFDHTQENNHLVQSSPLGNSYIISYASIISRELFNSIVANSSQERRWPKLTPFDFEKAPEDLHWLPIRRANPKNELFASIDDDHGEFNSCLQSRNLYPKRLKRQSYAINEQPFILKLFGRLIKWLGQFRRAMINTLFVPKNYRLHYIASLFSFSRMHYDHFPQMNYRAIDRLLSKMMQVKNIFEYGSGQLTLFWVYYGKNLVSIEHDPSTYQYMKAQLSSEFLIDYRLIEPEIDIYENKYDNLSSTFSLDDFQSDAYKGYSFQKYVESIEEFSDGYFDIVLIGGPAGSSCIKQSIKKIKPGGLLIIKSLSNDNFAQEVKMLLVDWDREIFFGPVPGKLYQERTAVYTKPISNTL